MSLIEGATSPRVLTDDFQPVASELRVSHAVFGDGWTRLHPVTVEVGERLQAAPWCKDFLRLVRALSSLAPNWNGYGERPIHPASLKRAVALLDAMDASQLPAPSIVPVADGSVQIEWHLRTRSVEVEVPPSGDATGFAYNPGNADDGVEWRVAGQPNDRSGLDRLVQELAGDERK